MFRILNSRGRASVIKQLSQSSTLTSAVATNAPSDKELLPDKGLQEDKGLKPTVPRNLVSAAFSKLKTLGQPIEVQDSISRIISEAKNLEELLNVVTVKKLTRNHALKVSLVYKE